MNFNNLTVEARDHVLFMGLNRPAKRNAFDLDLFRSLSLAYGELERNRELRCGVLFAHGDHFTGGIDLPQWAPRFAEGKFIDPAEGGMDPLGLVNAHAKGNGGHHDHAIVTQKPVLALLPQC